jgi:hypothetical protein
LGGCDSARTYEDLSLVEKEDERGFSPYCTKVLDYYYAPGQHAYLAKFPDFVNGDSCTQSILLGGWGGFVVFDWKTPFVPLYFLHGFVQNVVATEVSPCYNSALENLHTR